MNRFWMPLLVLASLALSSCSHEASSTASTPGASAVDCEKVSQIICTREYLPTSCSFDSQEFAATNPCEAKKLAQDYACKNNKSYADASVKCATKPALTIKNECEAERTVCTREFKPSVCRFGDVEAKGNNRCEALNSLRTMACSKKLAFVSDEAVCEAGNSNVAPKKKRSR